MHLYEVPLWFALVGLALYTVLGGADFGAGFWQLVAGGGNPGGSLVTSWLNPTSIAIGVLAVASGAYTSAVFLSGDAERHGHGHGDRALADRFRARALGAGLATGAIAIGALIVLHFDAERIFRRLTQGVGLPALVASVIAGIATLALVW